MRYSTARSGLLKLALKALITCSRSKPISIIFEIVVCNTLPERNELVSPNAGAGASGWGAAAGVAGAAGAAGATDGASDVDVTGATGAAGTGAVGAGAGTGAGTVLLVATDVLVETAGVALGCIHHEISLPLAFIGR